MRIETVGDGIADIKKVSEGGFEFERQDGRIIVTVP
jgi:hypothetical protein